MKAVVAYDDPFEIADHLARKHQQLRDLSKQLRAAISTGHGARARQLFMQLQILEQRHFETEEAAMRRFGYPGYGDHKSYHDTLRETQDVVGRVMLLDQPKLLHEGIASYVGQTLAHIEEVDRHLEAFLRALAANSESRRQGGASPPAAL